jgi:hypothetical protein
MIVGDTQRIILYGKIGYLETQDIPAYVIKAMNELIKLGYDKQLSAEEKLSK